MPRPQQQVAAEVEDEIHSQVLGEEYRYAVARPTRLEQLESLAMEAMVVYLGRNPHFSAVFEGCTATETRQKSEGPVERWMPAFDRESLEAYDFSDPTRRTPAGDPYVVCRHIGHLAQFMRRLDADRQPLFKIFCKTAQDQTRLEAYLLSLERAEAKARADLEAIYRERGE